MGNNPKVMIGLGVIALLGVGLILKDSAQIGAIVVILAIGAAVLMLRSGSSTSDEDFLDAPEERPARSSSRASSDAEPLPTFTTLAPAEEAEDLDYDESGDEEGEALPSWGGSEPLTAWTPPEDGEDEDAYGFDEPVLEEDTALAEFEELDFADDDLSVLDDDLSVLDDDFSVLDAEFEEILEEEAEAEPEPVAEKPKGFSFGNNSLIKKIEDVHSDADIMQSSAATELVLSSDKGEDSELARLLAKVQSRLATYE